MELPRETLEVEASPDNLDQGACLRERVWIPTIALLLFFPRHIIRIWGRKEGKEGLGRSQIGALLSGSKGDMFLLTS